MHCPNDKTELEKSLYESVVEVDECKTCHGLWLDAGELEKKQKTIENDYTDELKKMPDHIAGAFRVEKEMQEALRVCPKCHQPMNKKEYGYCSQVIVDVCSSCWGIWLDNGEIQRLEIFFERSRANTKGIRKGFLGNLLSFFK